MPTADRGKRRPRAKRATAVAAPRDGSAAPAAERLAGAALDALAAHIAILDETGTILAVNRAWREFAAANRLAPVDAGTGANYLAVCDATRGPDTATAAELAAAVRAIIRGQRREYTLEYPCHSPDEQRWFTVRVTRLADHGAVRVVVAHENITARRQVEADLRASREQLRALAARLQAVREEERTHVAREIHDVLAQELTRLKFDLLWLQRRLAKPGPAAQPEGLVARVAEMCQTTDTAIHCVQRIATGLRPAVLDSLGLCAAVEWQARDVGTRAGLLCRVTVPEVEPPLDRRVATATFRILQESLTNIVRHAQATRFDVSLRAEAGEIVLRVSDNGRGIPPEALGSPLSIGLVGMRERALMLGGTLEVRNQPGSGTIVEIRLPLAGSARCEPTTA